MKRLNRYISLIVIPLLSLSAFGCRTFDSQYGEKNIESIYVPDYLVSEIEVLDTTYTEALNNAFIASQIHFPHLTSEIRPDQSALLIKEQGPNPAVYLYEPVIINNLDDPKEYGILFKMPSGTRSRPSQGARNFQDAYLVEFNSTLKTKTFANYRICSDKGVPDIIEETIPADYQEFQNYLEAKEDLKPFEGIWTTSDGLYTLGIVSSERDPRYGYLGFILESRRSNWKPGEVKVRFSSLRPGRRSTGEYRLHSKAPIGLVWETDKLGEQIFSQNLPDGAIVYLLKSYPLAEGDSISGSGTAWAIDGEGTFITCYHVVEYADRIFIGFKDDNPVEARVIAEDKKLDLAIVKIYNNTKEYRPLPIFTETVDNGTTVTVLGYPLSFDLGDDLRVTEGVISAQSGMNKDVTSYQIDAAVQPGNSGGPVFDDQGRVIGVAVSKLIRDDSEK